MPVVISRQTWSRIQHILNTGPVANYGPPESRGGVKTWNPVLVVANSATAVGGSDVGDQCFDATVLKINSLNDEQVEGASVWLTVLNGAGSAETPVVGVPYHGLYAGRFDPGDDPRLRVFAATGQTGSDGPCGTGLGWIRGLHASSVVRATICSVGGRCDCEDTEDYDEYLTNFSGGIAGYWTSTTPIVICGTSYYLHFRPVPIAETVGPQVSLVTVGTGPTTQEYGQIDDWGHNWVTMAFGVVCDGDDAPGCSQNVLIVRFELDCSGITTACCPEIEIPRQLFVTLVATGDCDCLDGLTIPLLWDEGEEKWLSGFVAEDYGGCAGLSSCLPDPFVEQIYITFACSGNWILNISRPAVADSISGICTGPSMQWLVEGTCSLPFLLAAEDIIGGPAGGGDVICSESGGTLAAIISETPP